MKLYKSIAAAIFLLMIGIGPALGADFENYVVGKLGAYSPNSHDLSDFSSDFNSEVAFGHYLNPNVALELGVGYFQTDGNISIHASDTFFGKEKIEVTPLTFSLKLIQPLSPGIELYGIGGVDAYFVHDSIDASSSTSFLHLNDDDTAFGAHLGGGIQFNLNRNVFLGGEFKYLWTKVHLYGDDVNLDGYRFTGNIGFRF